MDVRPKDRPVLSCQPANYQPTTLEYGQFRLLHLHPAVHAATDLVCEIEVVDLKSDTNFTAISYVWGEPSFPEKLYISGSLFHITKSLAQALRQFRLSNKQITLWADAVCINQSDNEEKSRQVPLMKEIYGNAETVLAWLGELPEDVNIDTERLQLASASIWIAQGGHTPKGIRIMDDVQSLQEELESYDSTKWEKIYELVGLDEDLNPCGMKFLYSNPWFTRVWTIQEAALTETLTLCLGDSRLQWVDFQRLCMLLHLFVETTHPCEVEAWKHFKTYCWPTITIVNGMRRRRIFKKFALETWFNWVFEAASRQCSNERDHVYGLLGLIPDEFGKLLRPDYNKSVEAIYTEVARLAMSFGILRYIYCAGLFRRPDHRVEHINGCTDEYLPTWAPDYRCRKYENPHLIDIEWTQDGFVDPKIVDGDRNKWTKISGTSDPHAIAINGIGLGSINFVWDASEFRSASLKLKSEAESFERERSLLLRNELKRICRSLESIHSKQHQLSEDTWERQCLTAFIRALDVGSVWNAFGEMCEFDPKTFKFTTFVNTYLKFILEGEGEYNPATSSQAEPEIPGVDIQVETVRSAISLFENWLRGILEQFDFFATTIGDCGITPSSPAGCRLKDWPVFVDGGNVPLILRQHAIQEDDRGNRRGIFCIIGPCQMSDFDREVLKVLGTKSDKIYIF